MNAWASLDRHFRQASILDHSPLMACFQDPVRTHIHSSYNTLLAFHQLSTTYRSVLIDTESKTASTTLRGHHPFLALRPGLSSPWYLVLTFCFLWLCSWGWSWIPDSSACASKCWDHRRVPPRPASFYSLLLFKVHFYFVLCGAVWMSASGYVEVRGQLAGLPSHQVVSGIEHRPPGLVAGAFTCWVISWLSFYSFESVPAGSENRCPIIIWAWLFKLWMRWSIFSYVHFLFFVPFPELSGSFVYFPVVWSSPYWFFRLTLIL